MLKQSLQQKLLQKLSPQQIQLMKLLQVPTVELEQRIEEEIEENPALEEGAEELNEDEYGQDSELNENNQEDEFDITDYLPDEDIPAYKMAASNKGVDDEEKSIPFAAGSTFQDLLYTQLGMRILSEEQQILARHLIGNLDDSGYLRRELDAIVDDVAFSLNIQTSVEELEELLLVIQEFDPPGVGARSLQENLLLQIKRKQDDTDPLANALVILEKYFEEFTKKHYSKISKRMGIEEEDLKQAIEEILKLNPKPGSSMAESSRAAAVIIPDFAIAVIDGKLELTINSRNAPSLRISKSYAEMLQAYAADKTNKENKDAFTFVKQKIDSAKWFIDAIQQRQQTLMLTMNAIMEYQKEYFLEGDETKLKPMILKDIAEIVSLDISTISRVANSKYVQTPYGTFLLKSFFSESLSTDSGEEVSTREVKKILQDKIDAEDKRKPLTDEKLASVLKEKGYNIARRTVAKYREQLNIPVARLRKEL